MRAMIRSTPPQAGQGSMSMPKTRFTGRTTHLSGQSVDDFFRFSRIVPLHRGSGV
jgi:hypothetical protein